MKTFVATPWPDLSGTYRFHSHGRIHVNSKTTWFGFQIHASNTLAHPTLIFALIQEQRDHARNHVKFGVRLDLRSGAIYDIANHTGVIGSLDQKLWPQRDDEYPILLRWEVEHTGQVLIPRLHIGFEEWLYPSLLFPGDSNFTAVTGHDADDRMSDDAVFSPGYVWCQDRLR